MLKIREGKEYKFFVEKEIEAPDNKYYFVLKGPDQKRYLLPGNIYSDYNIKENTVIVCKVDKINCSGEVFLEPRNPWYTEGGTYNFKVVAHETRTGVAGSPVKVIIVSDRSQNLIAVPVADLSSIPRKGKEVTLKIERITKGKLYLVNHSGGLADNSLNIGRVYEFVIEGTGLGVDDIDYFIIRDTFRNIHTIPREHYEYYGFKTGTRFRGKIVKYKKNGERTIEPENPYYEAGAVVKMKVTSCNKNDINELFTVNLTDDFGFTHCIELGSPPLSDYIRCTVKMIKKGKPLLLPL